MLEEWVRNLRKAHVAVALHSSDLDRTEPERRSEKRVVLKVMTSHLADSDEKLAAAETIMNEVGVYLLRQNGLKSRSKPIRLADPDDSPDSPHEALFHFHFPHSRREEAEALLNAVKRE